MPKVQRSTAVKKKLISEEDMQKLLVKNKKFTKLETIPVKQEPRQSEPITISKIKKFNGVKKV